MFKKIGEFLYRSFLGRGLSFLVRVVAKAKQPRMVYGYFDKVNKRFWKFTRISDTSVIMNPQRLSMADHVWVWHYSILDATEGLEIGEGCQIGAWVGIFTHGSQNAIRLYGRQYVHVSASSRKGYTRSPVRIGVYTFIGAGSIILPGTIIGKGCIIAAGSIVNGNIPDFSIVRGIPGKVIGDTREIDKQFLYNEEFNSTYFDEDYIKCLKGE